METCKKAYLGQDEDEAKVVFAHSKAEAKRFTDLPVRRASQYDEWAGMGYVPAKVLVEQFYWWFSCHQDECNNKIGPYDDMGVDGDGEDFELQPVYVGKAIYCCPACNDKANATAVRHRALADELRAGLLQGWPGVTPGACATYNQPPFIFFKFPGGKHDARWQLGADCVQICALDAEAYDAYKASVAPTPATEGAVEA